MGGFQIFFSIQVVYYGIGFATDSLGLNLYINNLIISAFEVAAYCISGKYKIKYFSRLFYSKNKKKIMDVYCIYNGRNHLSGILYYT